MERLVSGADVGVVRAGTAGGKTAPIRRKPEERRAARLFCAWPYDVHGNNAPFHEMRS